MGRTASENKVVEVPGWYIELQTAVLKQLPRPGNVDQATAEYWTTSHQGDLKEALANCLLVVKFVIRKMFVVDTKPNAQVKIGGLGNNFQNWFLDLVEGRVLKVSLVPMVLDHAMFDHEIITKLGGVAKAITAIGEVFSLMKKQPNGPKSETGQLHVDGRANIFYVPQPVTKLDGNRSSYVNLAGVEIEEEVKDLQYLFEINGQWYVLRAVYVGWYVGGWSVDALSVESPIRWSNGGRAFSRKALDSSATAVA